MAKKRKSPNQDIGFEKVVIDPRIEKSIFCKKMSIVTFLVMTDLSVWCPIWRYKRWLSNRL